MKSLSFKVPETLDRRLSVAVKRRGKKKSVMMREALEHYLDEPYTAKKGSFLDLAGDLLGCVRDAPTDLSSNPKHLANLGK